MAGTPPVQPPWQAAQWQAAYMSAGASATGGVPRFDAEPAAFAAGAGATAASLSADLLQLMDFDMLDQFDLNEFDLALLLPDANADGDNDDDAITRCNCFNCASRCVRLRRCISSTIRRCSAVRLRWTLSSSTPPAALDCASSPPPPLLLLLLLISVARLTSAAALEASTPSESPSCTHNQKGMLFFYTIETKSDAK